FYLKPLPRKMPRAVSKNKTTALQQESGREKTITTTESTLVAAAKHLGEGSDLILAAALFARLFVVALRTNTFDDVLTVELLFHATQRTINRLVFADFDFDGHVANLVGTRKKD